MTHRVPGSDYVSQRDAKLRQERLRRLEREAIRNGQSAAHGARVTVLPPAPPPEDEPRPRRKKWRRRAPG